MGKVLEKTGIRHGVTAAKTLTHFVTGSPGIS
jgi:hypothetical protein